MIVGIGTDIVQVSRMTALLGRYGERFPRRILTGDEFKKFSVSKQPAYFLAKRFAAKEAAAKALGTGFGSGLRPCHIGVGHTERGQPFLEWQGRANELVRILGVSRGLLSLADEKEYALAFVTLLAEREGAKPGLSLERALNSLKLSGNGDGVTD
ncbi:holo-ACP synthase [Nitrosococcus oceani]|uniref:holo-ACP synthase n=1 Tax=Nitrosococcus oceani TaxID=1229 RepID=UPI0004E866F8|nr:holo-ACP synthase [Nitrosococcus oceani]KFI23387.1 ACP synthase [Nitrosococcus oceani]